MFNPRVNPFLTPRFVPESIRGLLRPGEVITAKVETLAGKLITLWVGGERLEALLSDGIPSQTLRPGQQVRLKVSQLGPPLVLSLMREEEPKEKLLGPETLLPRLLQRVAPKMPTLMRELYELAGNKTQPALGLKAGSDFSPEIKAFLEARLSGLVEALSGLTEGEPDPALAKILGELGVSPEEFRALLEALKDEGFKEALLRGVSGEREALPGPFKDGRALETLKVLLATGESKPAEALSQRPPEGLREGFRLLTELLLPKILSRRTSSPPKEGERLEKARLEEFFLLLEKAREADQGKSSDKHLQEMRDLLLKWWQEGQFVIPYLFGDRISWSYLYEERDSPSWGKKGGLFILRLFLARLGFFEAHFRLLDGLLELGLYFARADVLSLARRELPVLEKTLRASFPKVVVKCEELGVVPGVLLAKEV